MKLISMNVWGGREFESLMKYIKENSDADIFCFQEVFDNKAGAISVGNGFRANLFNELQKAIPNHIGYFAPATLESKNFVGSTDYPLQYGLAMFIQKALKVNSVGEFYVYGHYNSNYGKENALPPRNLQYADIRVENQNYTIAHFHGIWNGGGKLDSEERLEQSRIAKHFLSKSTGRKIMCGDFNLLPDTKSLAILEEGLINLVKVHGIKTTRSSLYTRTDKYADYTLVSPDVNVRNFHVPAIKASDHLPMELEFS